MPHLRAAPALPGKVRGKEREDEQAEVAGQHSIHADPGHAGLDRQARPDGESEDDRQLAPRRGAGVVGTLRDEGELLPQQVGVLAGEFARDGVEVAQPFDRDQESLLVVEPGRLPVGHLPAQVGHLPAQVVLKFVDVGGGDRLAPLDVATPPVDLGLQLGMQLHHAHPPAAAGDR